MSHSEMGITVKRNGKSVLNCYGGKRTISIINRKEAFDKVKLENALNSAHGNADGSGSQLYS